MKNVGKKLTNNKKGFTIIEVVLVLAIAGLIFLIVFLAVPALQRNRRDTQRRSDLSRFVAQLENYAANSNGNYPDAGEANSASFKTDYMDTFRDPSASTGFYTIQAQQSDNTGVIHYSADAQCNDDGTLDTPAGGARKVAASIKLEAGRYCQDNS